MRAKGVVFETTQERRRREDRKGEGRREGKKG